MPNREGRVNIISARPRIDRSVTIDGQETPTGRHGSSTSPRWGSNGFSKRTSQAALRAGFLVPWWWRAERSSLDWCWCFVWQACREDRRRLAEGLVIFGNQCWIDRQLLAIGKTDDSFFLPFWEIVFHVTHSGDESLLVSVAERVVATVEKRQYLNAAGVGSIRADRAYHHLYAEDAHPIVQIIECFFIGRVHDEFSVGRGTRGERWLERRDTIQAVRHQFKVKPISKMDKKRRDSIFQEKFVLANLFRR